MGESSTQNYILKKLNTIENSEWEKATITNKAGSPDIKGHIEGFYIAIEVKYGRNKLSELQEYRISETKKKRGVAFGAYSWADVLRELCEASRTKGFAISFRSICRDNIIIR